VVSQATATTNPRKGVVSTAQLVPDPWKYRMAKRSLQPLPQRSLKPWVTPEASWAWSTLKSSNTQVGSSMVTGGRTRRWPARASP
jgi:hypothetical protein